MEKILDKNKRNEFVEEAFDLVKFLFPEDYSDLQHQIVQFRTTNYPFNDKL